MSKASGKVELGSRPVPTPGPGQVLVKIQAAALNPVDNYNKNYGGFVDEFGFPALIGNDGAGTIEDFAPDLMFLQGYWNQDRCTLQQYALGDAIRCAKIPENLSFDEASTIPLGLATAAIGMYHAPVSIPDQGGGAGLIAPWTGGVGKYAGQAVVVFGGSSSVGQFALQLAKLSGFSPIITTASKNNEAYCKSAGATHVIDYRDVHYDNVPAAILKITDNSVPLVYDAISSEASQKAGWAILGRGGSMVVTLPPAIGVTPGQVGEDGKRLVHVYGNVHRETNRQFGTEMYSHLTTLLAKGELKPNNVEILPDGLAGVSAGLDRLSKGVSAVKLVARPQETA
ncbi:GroES-like protein [Amylostereum chailletii]|nr:GroES-like protein [Amylostereum chailletii]